MVLNSNEEQSMIAPHIGSDVISRRSQYHSHNFQMLLYHLSVVRMN